MRTTRIIAITIVSMAIGLTAAGAQTLQEAEPPAEFPPATYTGKQYVDSRGCIYIRAGIDGNVTWVPRVSRNRKQVCGQEPTLGSRATELPRDPVRPATTTTVAAPPAAKAPAQRKPASAPRRTVRTTAAPRPAPSAPAAVEVPQGSSPTYVVVVPFNDRVVPRHVYDNRRNTRNVTVPKGYRPVWKDDRLNPYRAERTTAPARLEAVRRPPGYLSVDRKDGRLNPRRGGLTEAGDAQTDRIWTRTVPRKLVEVPTGRNASTLAKGVPQYLNQAPAPQTVRLSTRSESPGKAGSARRYVRVSLHADPDEAASVGRALARQGLPIRYGSLKRRGSPMRAVLAGPFTSDRQARAALVQVRQAGFASARLSK